MQVNTKSKIGEIASTDPNRDAINHLNVVIDHPVIAGAALEATDGRRYVAIPVSLDPKDVPGMLPRTIIRDIARVKRLFKALPNVAIIKKKWLRFCDRSLVPRRQDKDILGTYPAGLAHMPRANGDKPAPVTTYALNAKYLASISAAFGTESDSVLLTFYGDLKPVEVTPAVSPGGDEGYGVLMPVRCAGIGG